MSQSPPATSIPFQIRRMAPADLDSVVDLAASLNTAPQWPRAVYSTAIISPEESPMRIALVAEALPSEGLLGFAIAMILAPESELETIAIANGSQRRGVGRRLFAALAAELSVAGATDVHLEVRPSNGPALAFYAALGFEVAGRRTSYYTGPAEDALQLRLRLLNVEAK